MSVWWEEGRKQLEIFARERQTPAARAFFVRVNNSTRALEGADLVGYVKQRWA